ncbi:hypothetical protein HK405_013095 [Cladochytrium tenue]|nr:hypothetical protein HK405_013095 [Cladochytrium tenue]
MAPRDAVLATNAAVALGRATLLRTTATAAAAAGPARSLRPALLASVAATAQSARNGFEAIDLTRLLAGGLAGLTTDRDAGPATLAELMVHLESVRAAAETSPVLVVLDCADLLQLEFGTPAVARLLTTLAGMVCESLGVVVFATLSPPAPAPTTHDPIFSAVIESYFTATLDVVHRAEWADLAPPGLHMPPLEAESSGPRGAALYVLTLAKKSGRVVREVGTVRTADSTPFTLWTRAEERAGGTLPASASGARKPADPAEDLPFNLRLTDEQRRAKASTVLPHLEAQERTAVGGAGPSIFVERDVGDSDEDPDDDLGY